MKSSTRMLLAMTVACMATWAGAAEKEWQVQITPYAWLVNVDGTVGVGDKEADFNADFTDLIDKVDLAGCLMAVGTYDRWVCFAQADFFSLSQDFERGPGGELESDILFLNGAAGYRFGGLVENATTDVLVGLRYFRNENTVEVNGVGSADGTSDLVDAMLTLRSSHPLVFVSEKLHLEGAASIGAGDSDLVWELQMVLQYQFNDRLGARAGYRRLEYELEDGPVEMEVGFQGLLIGLDVSL